jgi:hypothetical protein
MIGQVITASAHHESEQRRLRGALVIVAAALILVGLLFVYAVPLLRHNAAEANCVAAIPRANGTPGGNGSSTVSWELVPIPHWDCSYETDAGRKGNVGLDWWGNPR